MKQAGMKRLALMVGILGFGFGVAACGGGEGEAKAP